MGTRLIVRKLETLGRGGMGRVREEEESEEAIAEKKIKIAIPLNPGRKGRIDGVKNIAITVLKKCGRALTGAIDDGNKLPVAKQGQHS
ncbi:hypothetical protein C1H46_033209 [Malus baccata]|uniref:Uncharacterized protein n=1 Tax=Malus baccata TaxID=106549 RepID=A0A540L3X4_MALBA|nr:hypothetical protein C1H46_033209 [Malus baccata]